MFSFLKNLFFEFLYFIKSMTDKTLYIEEESSSEDLEEPLAKKSRMNNKTPISILTELCAQKRVSQPQFTEDVGDDLSQEFSNMGFKFFIKCTALSKSAYAGGVTKKSAKHEAAQKLLNKIHQAYEDSDDDDIPKSISRNDYVTELLDLCVQKNFHKPEFNLVESYGPTHCPTFTYECKLDSIKRTGSATNKTLAKKLSAKGVLDILRLSYPDQEKKLILVNDQNMAKEEARRKITSYLDLKKHDLTDKMGTLLSERHHFFLNYKHVEFINSLKEILSKNMDMNEKYKELLAELKTEWEYTIEPFADTNLLMFNLLIDFEQFTVNLVSTKEDLEMTVVDYFMKLLHLAPTSNIEPSKIIQDYEVKLIPLNAI